MLPCYSPCFYFQVSVVQSSPAQPRHLHVTKAVYIRHIPPQVSPADILEVS